MTYGHCVKRVRRHVKAAKLAAMLAGAAFLAACSGMNPLTLGDAASTPAMQDAAPADDVQPPRSELEKATEFWGKQYAKSPADGAAALSYAKNLKAMGRKKEALAILQQTHPQNSQNREHLSEYGRLALDLGQVSTAKSLLERADDPAKPDWRVISARGTVLAKEGQYKEAIAYFERARALAPGQASILNNLAMAHAMNGEAAKAETLLRQATDAQGGDARVRQNLALVLGVQGKHSEAKTVAGMDPSNESGQANADDLHKMVRPEPKPAAVEADPASSTPKAASSVKSRKSSSPVATASIVPSHPDEIIGAAMLAEAAKRSRAAGSP
jgi:Flp pilus assembly protein TadD